MSAPQKGALLLSMPRSGSSWLGDITNATNVMGKAEEWLDFKYLTPPHGPKGRPALYQRTLASASTENGNFQVKLFPRHLLQVQDSYEMDFIRKCRRDYDTQVFLLTRQDRVAQAISLVRAMQSGKWSADSDSKHAQQNRVPKYNFGAISQAAFHIGRGYEFWRSYLTVGNVPFQEFTYESLLENPAPYVDAVSSHFGVAIDTPPKSDRAIQRDDISAQWRARFAEDINAYGVPASTYSPKQPIFSLRNAYRILRGKPAKFDRFGYSL